MTTLLRPMRGRDVTERHRASTPLELFFDLTFVVGVSFAAEGFAHELEIGDGGHGLLVFVMVFFAIWWGWMNFTWFASAYDTDDWLYRVVTLVQMSGALVVAAGVPRALESEDFTVIVVGYLIMRLAMVFQWLRAARSDPEHRTVALTYAVGVAAVQVLWVLRLWLPDDLAVASFFVLAVAEAAIPFLAEQRQMTPFHTGHIAERYGLFTLIVLGEGVLATAKSVVAAVDEGEHVAELVVLAALGLVVVAAMWWEYFQVETVETLVGFGRTMTFGYLHYLVFAAAGAVSAGLEVQIAQIAGHSEASDTVTGLALGLPVAIFVLVVWFLLVRPNVSTRAGAVCPVVAVLAAAAGALPTAPLVTTAVIAGLLVVMVATLVAAVPRDLARSDIDLTRT
ncbi:low temperature requirement protein A [Jatrophihabitans sp. YIM 134969]